MGRLHVGLVAGLVALLTACGGGGGGGDDGVVSGPSPPSSTITGSFTADEPSPGGDTVSMSQSSASGSLVTISVGVTDTNDVYGAAFDMLYDPAKASFVGWSVGTLLEQGGNTPNYVVNTPQAGRVVAGVSRTGNVPGANASGTRSLVRLTFRVTEVGSSGVTFDASPALTDGQGQDIPNVSWFGGTLQGS